MESEGSEDLPEVVSADVSTDLARQIESEREEGESRSATVKRLIRAGLDAEQKRTTMNQMDARKIGALTLAAAIIAYVAANLPPLGPVGLVALLVVGIALATYGAAPLLRDAPDDGTDDDAVNRTTA